jgi:hypothetical protein
MKWNTCANEQQVESESKQREKTEISRRRGTSLYHDPFASRRMFNLKVSGVVAFPIQGNWVPSTKAAITAY